MDYQKNTILITEDEPAMLNILTDKLSESGFETIQAKNGEEGVMLALQRHPHLILVDILMPKIDGMTMISNLRKDAWGKTVPVIILTNVNPDTSTSLKAIVNNKPAYYFVKSDIKLDELVQKIKEIISSPKKNDQSL